MSKQHLPAMPAQTASKSTTFFVNLRLLNLDQREDWPGISVQTLSTKDALQNQKQRIRCVEWALYRLFEIWDIDETRYKLQPFFPPLEPLQSLNLRAALFRCLNELKKNGVLGKEVVIRKTMLDECKGEKLEEVLDSFSTIVLQKVLSASELARKCIAGRYGVAKSLPVTEQRSLLPLAIAHRASLTALLRRKQVLKARYDVFGSLLLEREQSMFEKAEILSQAHQEYDVQYIPNRTLQELLRQFEVHWHGDLRWREIIVEGGERDAIDPLFGSRFAALWSSVEDGTVKEGVNATCEHRLLQNLDQRVKKQRESLQHWKKVKDEICGAGQQTDMVRNDRSTGASKELDLDLKKHQTPSCNIGKVVRCPESDLPQEEPPVILTDEYRNLLESMQQEFDMVGKAKVNSKEASKQLPPLQGLAEVTDQGNRRPIAIKKGERKPSISKIGLTELRQASNSALPKPKKADKDPIVRPEANTSRRRSIQKAEMEPAKGCADNIMQDHMETEDIQNMVKTSSSENFKTQIFSPESSSPPQEEIKASEEDILAQQIISSTINAAPSPIKPKKASLTERTRLSIAFSRPDILVLSSPSEPTTPTPNPSSPTKTSFSSTALNRRASLLDRTRESMSLLPPAVSKSKDPNRKSLHKRRQSRQNYPTNQFETPKKGGGFGGLEDVEERTPPDSLFEKEIDYASVFKSRPKIATSPSLSPTLVERMSFMEGDDGGD